MRGCPASLGVEWYYQLQGTVRIMVYLTFIECFSFANALQASVPLLPTSGMQIKVIGSIKQQRKKEGNVELYLILNRMCTISNLLLFLRAIQVQDQVLCHRGRLRSVMIQQQSSTSAQVCVASHGISPSSAQIHLEKGM